MCRYELHEFDLSKPVVILEKIADFSSMTHYEISEKYPIVYEMYQTFQGLYKMEECASVLSRTNNDLELATKHLL